MLPDQVFHRMLVQLKEKSERNLVTWQREKGKDDIYFVNVAPGYEIRLRRYLVQTAEPDFFAAWLKFEGEEIAKVRYEDGEEGFELLSALYSEAFRSVFELDKAIELLEQALTSDEPIGADLERVDQ